MYVSGLTYPEAVVEYKIEERWQAYATNFEGTIEVKDIVFLKERDSLEVVGPATLTLTHGSKNSHFFIIEMAETR
jgi:hypothetical protein